MRNYRPIILELVLNHETHLITSMRYDSLIVKKSNGLDSNINN